MPLSRRGRRWFAGVSLAVAAVGVACGGGSEDADAEVAPAATPVPQAAVAADASNGERAPGTPPPFRDGEQEIADLLQRGFPNADLLRRKVDLRELVVLLPPDSIASISDPQFVTTEEASVWMGDIEPVISFEHNGETRAYPLQIMTWHEIVNDVVGGEPVVVSFCPLCNTAIAFERTVNGDIRTFGTSGALRRSDLVMYDRETETLWQQIGGEAIIGVDLGLTLTPLPSQIVSFGEFRAAFPDAPVLSRDTGFIRNYGENPYVLYDRTQSPLFPVDEFEDGRLQAKERVLAIEVDGQAIAFPFSALSEHVVLEGEIAGIELVAFWQPGAVSPLDDFFIIGGRNVGSAGAFLPVIDGERVTFEARDGKIVDVATGSQWDVLGRAVSGPLAGTQLEQVVSGNHFWFAWSVFQPDTLVITGSTTAANAS